MSRKLEKLYQKCMKTDKLENLRFSIFRAESDACFSDTLNLFFQKVFRIIYLNVNATFQNSTLPNLSKTFPLQSSEFCEKFLPLK